MRKVRMVVIAALFLALGMGAATPVQAASGDPSEVTAAGRLLYYDTFYDPNPWWQCYDRGYQGMNNGEWYDFQCRPGTYWVDLYIQVAP